MAQFGAQTAFKRTLPFVEAEVLQELIPYLKKSLNLVDVEVWSAEEAKKKNEPGFTSFIIDNAVPGNPCFEFRNVWMLEKYM